MRSISFDRAAHNYDETRGLPPGVAEQVAEAAEVILGPGKNLLEIGVGTGRIAKPLLRRGFRLTGLDLSPKMMRRLMETLPAGNRRPTLVQGDAARLPFPAKQFDAVVSVHVFHLIADWESALDEARRVLRAGGVLLSGFDWRPRDSPGTLLLTKWRDIVQAHGLEAPRAGARDFEEIKAALLASGAAMDEREVGEWTTTRTLAQQLETIEHRTWSSTWQVPDDFFPDCLAELRAWAAAELGPLDREFTVPHRFVWQSFRWGA